jgi:hypothetical protein
MHLHRYVVCSHDDAIAVALWIMFAWVHDEVATHSPILDITSAEPESGKSTTLGLISLLAPRCLPSVEISEAALYRSIELWQPSFAIDEFDSVLASDDKAALRSVINSGHTRGQGVVKCVEPDFRLQHFKTFCPKAIGMVGRKLPASTISRCIVIELHRRKKDEKIEKFAHKDDSFWRAPVLRGHRMACRSDQPGASATNPATSGGFCEAARPLRPWCKQLNLSERWSLVAPVVVIGSNQPQLARSALGFGKRPCFGAKSRFKSAVVGPVPGPQIDEVATGVA